MSGRENRHLCSELTLHLSAADTPLGEGFVWLCCANVKRIKVKVCLGVLSMGVLIRRERDYFTGRPRSSASGPSEPTDVELQD